MKSTDDDRSSGLFLIDLQGLELDSHQLDRVEKAIHRAVQEAIGREDDLREYDVAAWRPPILGMRVKARRP